MHPTLREFLKRYVGVVVLTLVPVVLTTFMTIPMNLGAYPGEDRTAQTAAEYHLT